MMPFWFTIFDSSVESRPSHPDIAFVIYAVGMNSSSAMLLRNFMTTYAFWGNSICHSCINTRN